MSFLPGPVTVALDLSEKGKSVEKPFHSRIVTKRADGTLRVQHAFPGDSRAKQEFKDECDINYIMKRCMKNPNLLQDLIRRDGSYGDFSDAPDFMAAQDIIVKGKEQFAKLSAQQRDRFANDPVKFLEFASNAQNADEMAKLGLLKPEAVKRVREERKAASDAVLASKKGMPVHAPEENPSPKGKGGKRSVSNPSEDGDQ